MMHNSNLTVFPGSSSPAESERELPTWLELLNQNL